MTVLCEPLLDPAYNHRGGPREFTCVKCGTNWTDGTPAPVCSAMEISIVREDIVQRGPSLSPEESKKAFDSLGLEPMFVLRASDLLSDYLVEEWARKAEAHGCDPKRVKAARDKAAEMRTWPERRYPA